MERFGRAVALLALAAACCRFLFMDSGHSQLVEVARIAVLIGFATLIFLRAFTLVRSKRLSHKPLP
jgi:hypothetical protein